MEEIEIPTEHLHEQINEQAEERREKWSLYVALSTALMAVFAAVSGLVAGHHANEALIEQIKAANYWSYYQSKSIKSEIAAATGKIISRIPGQQSDTGDIAKIVQYEKEKEELKTAAEEREKQSAEHLEKHNILARGVTLFQIAIAMSAIAIITRKKLLWTISIVLAAGGCFFLLQGTLF